MRFWRVRDYPQALHFGGGVWIGESWSASITLGHWSFGFGTEEVPVDW